MHLSAYTLFDAHLVAGQPVLARWTCGARWYEAPSVVVDLGERWVKVRLLQPPRWMDVNRWTEATSVWPPGETRDLDAFTPIGPAPEWATPPAAPPAPAPRARRRRAAAEVLA